MYAHPLKPSKMELIETALKIYNISSILDLGACWGVHGGYTFHACEKGSIDRAVIVDGKITNVTRERAKKFPRVQMIQGGLGDRKIAEQIGSIDAIIMYDILLHQVDLDWNDFLSLWARKAKYLIIYNQNWTKDESVIRFNERNVEWYVENVPLGNEANVRKWYTQFDEYNLDMDRKWRDVHIFWQFGIPSFALNAHVESVGFRIDHQIHDGSWSSQYPWVVNDGLLASRI